MTGLRIPDVLADLVRVDCATARLAPAAADGFGSRQLALLGSSRRAISPKIGRPVEARGSRRLQATQNVAHRRL